jgi:hypothetical protein
MAERLRWKLWGLACRLPWVCPCNAHTAIVADYPGRSRRLRVDYGCRRDLAVNGGCYCGKLRKETARG